MLPGGPGAGIPETIGDEMREAQHVPGFQPLYDVVTFDPRGVGKSAAIRCKPAVSPKEQMSLDREPSQAEFDAVSRTNTTFIESRADATGELLWHLTAKDTAQDVERARQALSPNDGIVAYGAARLEAYPQNVKAPNLDGVVDHTVDYPTFTVRNVLGAQETKCALHGKDLGAAYDPALAREPRMLMPQFLSAGDNAEFGWPVIARLIVEAGGDGESKLLKQLSAVANLSTSEDPGLRVGKAGLFRGVMCPDYGPQQNYAEYSATSDMPTKVAPRLVWKSWNSMPIADVDGHQSLPQSKCTYEAVARFFAAPDSIPPTTLCGK